MGTTIFLLILHIACLVLDIVNAVMSDTKGQKICWIVCSVLWGICVVLDIISLAIGA